MPYLANEIKLPRVQNTAKTARPFCKNRANDPRNEHKIPTIKQMAKPFILVDQLNVDWSMT